jgi:hypothetical protein
MRYARLNTLIFQFCILLVACTIWAQDDSNFIDISGPYLGQPSPGTDPVLFAPDILPVDGIQHCFPAFSPDGEEVYWMKVEFEDERPRGEIWFMEAVGDRWTVPAVASFSGEYNDHSPVFSFDGNRLYFASNRPGGVGRGKNIWFVERTDTNWGKPVNLGSPPNSENGASQISFTRSGSVYFISTFEGTQWGTAIYKSSFADGEYQEPEVIDSPIMTEHADVYPCISPDESFLIFGSSRPGTQSTETDLYISFRNPDGTWAQPIHMNERINNGMTVSFSFVTHDSRYLFFNRFDSTGTDKFYWVNAGIIDEHRPDADSMQ